MQPTDAPGSERSATQQMGGWRWHLIGALITLALVGVVMASFAVIQMRLQATQTWSVYHDRLRLFSMRLPPDWMATEQYPGGSFTYTTPQGIFSGQIEVIDISDPTLGAASASLEIDVQQIPSAAAARAIYCGARSQETATFNGYPAETGLPNVILFESANAHFQINETIPGVLAPNHTTPLEPTPAPTATALPATTVVNDYALLSTALATFQPTDVQPLACP